MRATRRWGLTFLGLSLGLLLAAEREGSGASPLVSRWRWDNPLPQGNALLAVAGQGDDVCAVGGAGAVVCSSDGGATWRASQPVSSTLRGVVALASVFVAVGDDGVVLRSTNAGRDWQRTSVGGSVRLRAVVASGRNLVAVGDGGAVFLSRDEGRRWRRVSVPTRANLLAAAADGTALVVVGASSVVMSSGDGGRRWKIVPVPGDDTQDLRAVVLRGREVLISREGAVLSSTDGGSTYSVLATRDWQDPRSLARSPNGSIIAVGQDYADTLGPELPASELLTRRESHMRSLSLSAAWLRDDGLIVAVGRGGRILVSRDGARWRQATKGVTAARIWAAWADKDERLYAATADGTVLIRNPREASWRMSNLPVELDAQRDQDGRDLNAIWGDGAGTVFVGSTWGRLFKSSDAGAHWQQVPTWPEASITGIAGNTAGLIVAGPAVVRRPLMHDRFVGVEIRRSLDQGKTWSTATSLDRGSYLLTVGGGPTGEYTAVGSDGLILQSTEHGRRWNRVESGTSEILLVVRQDERQAWIGGVKGVVLRRRAGEETWRKISLGTEDPVASIGLGSGLEVVIVFRGGRIATSQDGGDTWTWDGIATDHMLNDIVRADGKWWVFGDDGTILVRD